MKQLLTLIVCLLASSLLSATPWETTYRQIEQSIQAPQFPDKTYAPCTYNKGVM